MKKLFVAVSAISTFTLLSTTVSADMGSWVSKKPSQPQTAVQPERTQQIEQAIPAAPAVGTTSQQPEVQVLPSHPQTLPGQVQRPQQRPPQQQQNNQVAQENMNQERVARAMQSVMPNAVNILNTPSLNNTQKNYGFSYIAAMSQMLSDPKNMNMGSVQQTYNAAVTCATRTGAGNVIGQLQGVLLSNPVLLENFQIAQGRGNFVAIGQQAPGITCQ